MIPNEHLYSVDEICALLEKAQGFGFSLEAGSELERMTIADVEHLVDQRQ